MSVVVGGGERLENLGSWPAGLFGFLLKGLQFVGLHEQHKLLVKRGLSLFLLLLLSLMNVHVVVALAALRFDHSSLGLLLANLALLEKLLSALILKAPHDRRRLFSALVSLLKEVVLAQEMHLIVIRNKLVLLLFESSQRVLGGRVFQRHKTAVSNSRYTSLRN